jgi:DNA-binding transcriptional MerR regulator
VNPSPGSAQEPVPENAAALTIGQLARRTGVTPEQLRVWEARHGFPRPQRLPSGHRRYPATEADLVARVLGRREAGVRLDVAIAEVLAAAAPGAPSTYAALRRTHPELAPQRLRKSTLIALSWALEDEFCARAAAPVLFGSFQSAHFYRPSHPRWRELARVATAAVVLGDFPATAVRDGVQQVALPPRAPMLREWTVVCDAPDLAACLTAWELPGQDRTPDRERVFETLWTIDPRAVRVAARTSAQVALEAGWAGGAPLLHRLADDPPHRVVDVVGATVLLNRVVGYVDRVR